MKVLIIKTSSMGDVIHTLPALTDAGKAIPGITFDWVVEENFAEIPRWHPLVRNIIPVAWRRWRKKILSLQTLREWKSFIKTLRVEKYDLVIDAQGLVKSAFFTCFARGLKAGLSWQSARESLASIFYCKRYQVMRKQHAIQRVRSLLSQALGYTLLETVPDYGIDRQSFQLEKELSPYIVFLHGTTWETKHWPETYWQALANSVNEAGYIVKLPWGNQAELERAQRIAASCQRAEVLPRLVLKGIAQVLASAKAVVAVDTGLGHLTAALDVPAVSIYGPTNPVLTGALGRGQVHLSAQFACAPCLSKTCLYNEKQTHSSLSEPSDLRSSALYPPCFTTVDVVVVWRMLSTLL